MAGYLVFWARMLRTALTGGRAYFTWMGFLLVGLLVGLASYAHHLSEGLIVTNMSDQVPWGIGIANFVYFVGVAAGAAIVVVPAYAYKRADMKDVAFIGEILAAIAILLCMLFIMTDVGQPLRLWHLAPGIGILNLPSSLLAWDVVVFSGYLAINLHIPGYVLYKRYRGQKPKPLFYLPLVFLSMGWAVSIHTVTAFLLAGAPGRAMWNTAILAPRFLVSAGASAPALLLLIFTIVRARTNLKIEDSVFGYLKSVLRITLPINLFLVACEFFQSFYSGGHHAIPMEYLFFGLDGHNDMPPFIWTAIVLETAAVVIFSTRLRSRTYVVYVGALFAIVGVWIEKGIGLIFPGFTPSQLGEISDYVPSLGELAVCGGVLSLGLLLFTAAVKVAVAILTGELRSHAIERTEDDPEDAPVGVSA